MPINPNIPLGVRAANIALPDYDQEQMRGIQLKNLMTQQSLQDQAIKDEQAQRQAFAQSGGDQNAYMKALMQGGNVKAYNTEQARQAELASKGATTAKTQGEVLNQSIARQRDQLGNVNNPQDAQQWVMAQYNDPVTGPVLSKMMPVEEAIKRIPSDPVLFNNWKNQAALGATKFIERNTTTADARMGAETSRRGQDLSAATARRGQDLVDARSREANSIGGGGGGKPPAGYRWGADGKTLEAIPGGPAEKIDAEVAARLGLTKSFLEQLPNIRSDLQKGGVTGAMDAPLAALGIGEQGRVRARVQSGVDALIRNLTGAGMSVPEAEAYAKRYAPTLQDTSTTVLDKVDQLERELRSTAEVLGRGRGGTDFIPKAAPKNTKSGASVSNW